jgi:hypothetical protein
MAAVTSIIAPPDGTFSCLAMGTGCHTLFEKRIQTTPPFQTPERSFGGKSCGSKVQYWSTITNNDSP